VAKKANGGVNKSAAIRELYKQNPEIKVKEVVSSLETKGIKVSDNLVYLIKGKLKGEKKRRRQVNRNAASVAKASGNIDAVATIIKVKALAVEVGGLNTLKALVEALSA
jgi:predicted PP-loop superfamily ATPase